jgi:hypothetical protein
MLVPTPSSTSAARETHQQNTRRWLRLAFVITIIVNWCLIGLRLLLSPAFFSQPNDLGYILEPVLSLAVYAAVGLAFLLSLPAAGQSALTIGTRVGLLTGVLWVINHAKETFATLPSLPATLISISAFLGAFVLWGVAGFLAARQTCSLRYGLIAALWSAMLTVLLTITFGFLLLLVALPQLAFLEHNDPDFLRSHWNNVTLFAIANTLDAGFSHLLEAPIIAVVFGIVGSLFGRLIAPKATAAPEA